MALLFSIFGCPRHQAINSVITPFNQSGRYSWGEQLLEAETRYVFSTFQGIDK